MTDTTFFIPTKAAFEHALNVGSIAREAVDDWMYMYSSVPTVGANAKTSWADSFKHRESRKYLHVRRYTFIEPSEPAKRPPVVVLGNGPAAEMVTTADAITEARAEFDRLERCRDAAPQLLKALVNLLRQTADPDPLHPAWKAARAEAVAAYKAAGWTPGEED